SGILATYRRQQLRKLWLLILIICLVLAAAMIDLAIGPANIAVSDIIGTLLWPA
ncbi:MAG TPA: iron ABC transporter permease, partial [Pusillimonas sp.]|nr:iron ABC transporter permease [Pusillimonas sp.]